jgi:hypothetical protein
MTVAFRDLRAAERAARRKAISHRSDDIFYRLKIQADRVEREREGGVLAALEHQKEPSPASVLGDEGAHL